MIRLHRFLTAALAVAGACFASFSPVAHAQAQTCDDAADIAVLPSPLAPWKGAPLRVIFAAEKPLQGELSLIAPNGQVAASSRERRGGPPYFWLAEIATPVAGKWQAQLVRDNAPPQCRTISRDIMVAATQPPRPSPVRNSVWPIRDSWNRATENLYSAWIEKLFEAPLDTAPSWPALHVVLRDPARNVLHNHLGLREDSINLYIRPDCADLPYFLRAYFAFKMGLPFGYAKCTRGGGGNPPRCPVWWNIEKEEPRPEAPEDIIAAANGQGPGAPGAPSQPRQASGLFDIFKPQQPAQKPDAKPGQQTAAQSRRPPHDQRRSGRRDRPRSHSASAITSSSASPTACIRGPDAPVRPTRARTSTRCR
jgi:hypothetical protein